MSTWRIGIKLVDDMAKRAYAVDVDLSDVAIHLNGDLPLIEFTGSLDELLTSLQGIIDNLGGLRGTVEKNLVLPPKAAPDTPPGK